MKLITATKAKLSSLYSNVEEANTDHVHGKAIIGEHDNLHAIVAQYLFSLKDQDGYNLESRGRESGSTPTSKNTSFSSRMPSQDRVCMMVRSPTLSALYSRVDLFLASMKASPHYQLFIVTDDIMKINDVDYQQRTTSRKLFLNNMGSDNF